MPAFAVMLIANFIFNPILTTYAELWLADTSESIRNLKLHIRKQMLFVAGLTVLGLAVAATIGIPVLSVIFGVDLGEYRFELCVVMLGGGALAYATYFSTVITVIRMQKTLMYVTDCSVQQNFYRIFVMKLRIMGAQECMHYFMIIWL